MPQLNVTVTADFSGVTVSNGTFSGSPSWSVSPDPLEVHNGQNNITWTLAATNLPANGTAAFSPTSPIAFKASNSVTWAGSTPTRQTDGTVQASDNFTGLSSAVHFLYDINIILTVGQYSQAYTKDPDIENEP